MRYLLLIFGGFILSGTAPAQSSGYVYVESEPSRPFYLRTADSLYTSSIGNYIILAPLGRLKGEIIVGFPGKQQAAFVFSLPDTVTDRGLILRDMQEEGWRLVDWRKNEPLFTRRLGRQEDEYIGMYRRHDAFAIRLSQVVNDSSVLFYAVSPSGQQITAARQPAAHQKQEKAIQPSAGLVPGKASGEVKPVTAVDTAKTAVSAGSSLLSGVTLISKTDTGKTWLLVYEVREGGTIERVEVEIEKDRITFVP